MSTQTSTTAIAQNIIMQFGGARAARMIGGTFVYGDDWAQVRFKAKARKIGRKAPNCVIITYVPALDAYRMKFVRIPTVAALCNGAETEVLETVRDVHVWSMRETFERVTGLFLSLR